MYFVYGSTYAVSNLCDHLNFTEKISQPIQKLLIVFLVNTVTSLIRDKKYTQEFGLIEKRNFPILSLALFFARDLMAMAAAFVLPPILGPKLAAKIDVSDANGERIVQLVLPVLQQIITTPTHLLGLDIYNRHDATLSERFIIIKGLYWNAVFLRMLRFLPAYGFGGVANTEFRKRFKNSIEKE